MKTILMLFLVISCSISFYQLGKLKASKPNFEIYDGVAERYFKTFGNPTTEQEQCNYEFVVYGDKYEGCN
ncbi:MAG: hypothetical protein HC854_08875 [Flavobacterium sp.]|nr:hypothetical protein [Flavobacterium sp.]